MTSKLYPTLNRAFKKGSIDADFLTSAVLQGWITDDERSEIITNATV